MNPKLTLWILVVAVVVIAAAVAIVAFQQGQQVRTEADAVSGLAEEAPSCGKVLQVDLAKCAKRGNDPACINDAYQQCLVCQGEVEDIEKGSCERRPGPLPVVPDL